MNKKEKLWLDCLVVICDIFKKNKVPYFLDTGTLLGAIRDNTFIPWDNDIDIGVNFDDDDIISIIKKNSQEFYEKGFNVTSTSTDICVKKLKTDVEINIKFYKMKPEFFYGEFIQISGNKYLAIIHDHLINKIIFKKGYGLTFKTLSVLALVISKISLLISENICKYLLKKIKVNVLKIIIPKHLTKDQIQYSFYNIDFFVPKEYEAYLKHRYGEWKTEIKDYNYLTDDKAVL